MIHVLKTWPEVFDAVKAGKKRFEVRKDDRFFQSGDLVRLQRYNPELKSYTPGCDPLEFRVGWILRGGQFGIEPGYVVFQLEDVKEDGCAA
jgi:hypothetical protein